MKIYSWPREADLYLQRNQRIHNFRRAFYRNYFSLFHRLEVTGRENIPDGPVLLYANHGGGFDLDVLAMSYAFSRARPVQVMIAENWHFTRSRWGRFAVASGIPTPTRGGVCWNYLDPFLKQDGSRKNEMVTIFPEGSQSTWWNRKRLLNFFPGVVRIALHYKVPLVPVAMVGFNRAAPVLYERPVDHGPADPWVMLPPWPKKLRIVTGEPLLLHENYSGPLSRGEEEHIANTMLRPLLMELLNRWQLTSSHGQ